MTVAKRQCLECGGELVMAFRPSGIGRRTPGAENLTTPSANWRCSTCGHSFCAEQLRADTRARLKAIVQTEQ